MTRLVAALALVGVIASTAVAQQQDLPPHLRDRGLGVRTSQFQTYIVRHQLIVFPFYAYTRDHNFEYAPASFGGRSTVEDLRGRYRSTEAVLFLGYGLTDWLALEVEGSRISATFDRSAADTSGTPARIVESGIADIGGQLRFRLSREHGRHPEIFGSLELLPPQHKKKVLIGDGQWNLKAEIGVARGFHWGTMTFRTTIERNRADRHWDLGETSLEYLRQLSPAWRVLLAIEGGEGGAPDDFAFVGGTRWRIAKGAYLKLDNIVGLMSKSTDWESQLGILLEFP